MSQAGMPLETGQTFSPPTVVQFSVFLPNKVGKMLDLVENFDEASGCNICAISVHEASDHAVVRFITNNAAIARRLLKDDGLAFAEHEVLVVELGTDHTLTQLCLYLLGIEINIAFAYALLLKPNGSPTIAIAVDDQTLAGQILRNKGFRLIGECDLPN